ncbi:unnamed protein product [Ranitomeya imitator]|uniref:Cation-transporting P-type ATPase N-terminal domain-containing protein n=1 Tax=Ranitomeya imitator TaxID=111125 RepID=A0ABN9KX03_9NEOB|nr:unnamed protein product [Ranitomeya imitator]
MNPDDCFRVQNLSLNLQVRYIRVQKTRYVWNPLEGLFKKIGVLEENQSCSDIHTTYGLGLSSEEQKNRQKLCGPNTIEVEISPIWKLLFKEILNPFYCFEIYSLSTWFATGYIEYSMAILLLTIFSVLATIYMLRMQSVKLHRMVESHNNVMVSMLQKNGATEEPAQQRHCSQRLAQADAERLVTAALPGSAIPQIQDGSGSGSCREGGGFTEPAQSRHYEACSAVKSDQ